MTEDIYLKIKETLIRIKKRRRDESEGICYNLVGSSPANLRTMQAVRFVCYNCEGWNGIQQATTSPISEVLAREGLGESQNKWEGYELKLRLSLLDHLISVCDEKIREVDGD